MRYHAFISYSHGADARLAPALQKALHRFAKPWWKARAVNVFRDETSLALAHSLPETLTKALAASEHFILMASPLAAQSKWVAGECAWWAQHKDPQRMLVVLSEGEIAWDEPAGDFDWAKTTALPPALRGVFKHEPFYLDLRWAKTSEQFSDRDPRFLDAVARISAALRGMSLDAIAGEEVRQHKKTRRIAYAAVSAIALLAAGASAAAWIAIEQRNDARRKEAQLAKNLANAIDAAELLVSELDEAVLLPIFMSADRWKKLITNIEAIFDRLQQAGDHPRFRHRQALMLMQFAEAFRSRFIADRKPENKGSRTPFEHDLEQAMLRTVKACAILEVLVQPNKAGAAYRSDFARCHFLLGELHHEKKEPDAAARSFERAARLAHELYRENRANLDSGLFAVEAEWRAGRVQEAFEILEAIASRFSGVADDYHKIKNATLALKPGDGPSDDLELRKASIYLKLATAMGDRYLREVVQAHEELAQIQTRKKDYGRAREQYMAALVLLRRMVEQGEADASVDEKIAGLLIEIGSAFGQDGDRESELRYLRDGLAEWQRLAAADPTNRERQVSLASALEATGRSLRAQGERLGALEALRESLRVRENLIRMEEQSGEDDAPFFGSRGLALLSLTEEIIGILVEEDRHPEVILVLKNRIDHWSKLASRYPTWNARVAADTATVGDLHLQQRDFAAAADAYQRALDLFERLAANPADLWAKTADWLAEMAHCRFKLAAAFREIGDKAAARRELDQARALLLRFADEFPEFSERCRQMIKEIDDEIRELGR
jgi:tetratricopeptide (TPR) repeat protein